MPCINAAPNDNEIIDYYKRQTQILTAIICALANEVDDEIITLAEKNGKVNIREYIGNHHREDIIKLMNIINNFSVHERKLMKQIFNKDKNIIRQLSVKERMILDTF